MPVDYGVATTPTPRPQTFDGNGQNPPSVDAGVARTPTTRPDTLDGNPERKIIPPTPPAGGPYPPPYSGPVYAITGTDPSTGLQVVGGVGGTALLSSVATGVAKTITTAGTTVATSGYYALDATSASFSQALPNATSFSGVLFLEAITTGTNLVTFTTTGGQTIDGYASGVLTIGTQASGAPYQSVTLVSDGSNLRIV